MFTVKGFDAYFDIQVNIQLNKKLTQNLSPNAVLNMNSRAWMLAISLLKIVIIFVSHRFLFSVGRN